jgi:hypothetical protein
MSLDKVNSQLHALSVLIPMKEHITLSNPVILGQGWAIVLAQGPLCGSGGWRRAAPFKMIAFIS